VSDFGGTFDPLADAIPGLNAPIDLRHFLLDAGVDRTEVDDADRHGTIELLALEKVLATDAPQYDVEEVAMLSGVSADKIRLYWRALGFPDPRPGEKLFSATDLAMLSDVVLYLIDGALEEMPALQMARVMGSSLERIASAHVDSIETARNTLAPGVAGDGDLFDEAALASDADPLLSIRRGAELLPLMPKMMEFIWHRHLSAAARKRRLRLSAGEGAGVCIGFADLVGFTAQTLELDDEELAAVVGRFEAVAYDVVTEHRGRVVKMIGDEVMFMTEDVRGGAQLALALSDRYREDQRLSDVRVGLASGPVLEREGDVYGPVVNLASRIVNIAYPGAVVVSDDVVDALSADEQFSFRSIRQHYLKDIGRVHLWTLRHRGDDRDERSPHARDPLAARREFLLSRRAKRLAESALLPASVQEEVVAILEDAGLLDDQADASLVTGDEPTQEFEAITDVVLDADLDEALQLELLADIEAARRLAELEREAQEKAEEADLEAEDRLAQIEEDTRRKVEHIEQESRRRIEAALAEAERLALVVNDEATKKVRKVADDAERKADLAEKQARRAAKRRAAKHKAAKETKTARPRKPTKAMKSTKAQKPAGGAGPKPDAVTDAKPDSRTDSKTDARTRSKPSEPDGAGSTDRTGV
jgi:adenylate cyclase